MGVYRLSREAAIDLDGIHEYTTINFGLTQAHSYLTGLHERFGALAQQPMLGRGAGRVARNLRRYEYQSHVVFYIPEDDDVLIVRILHKNMDVRRHFMDDEGDS